MKETLLFTKLVVLNTRLERVTQHWAGITQDSDTAQVCEIRLAAPIIKLTFELWGHENFAEMEF